MSCLLSNVVNLFISLLESSCNPTMKAYNPAAPSGMDLSAAYCKAGRWHRFGEAAMQWPDDISTTRIKYVAFSSRSKVSIFILVSVGAILMAVMYCDVVIKPFICEWSSLAAFAIALAFTTIVAVQLFAGFDFIGASTGKRCRLPPGPKGRFVVGNLSQMFRAREAGEFSHYVSQIFG